MVRASPILRSLPPIPLLLRSNPDGPLSPTWCLNPHVPVAGRLSLFHPKWIELDCPRWVLDIVSQGYKIPFMSCPKFLGVRETPLLGQYAQVLVAEVETLLLKGAIQKVHFPHQGYYSTYFLVPKKTGDLRPILNLKPINGSIEKITFKMETILG